MNKEELKNLEWNISHTMEFVEKNREILRKLGDILPSGKNFKVSTAAGHCSLSHEEICIIKTSVRCSMEECAAWVEQKTKELEELKHENQYNND